MSQMCFAASCISCLLLQHMLPNFNECWWDSWVLDVLVCNSLGEESNQALVTHSVCMYEMAEAVGV